MNEKLSVFQQGVGLDPAGHSAALSEYDLFFGQIFVTEPLRFTSHHKNGHYLEGCYNFIHNHGLEIAHIPGQDMWLLILTKVDDMVSQGNTDKVVFFSTGLPVY